MLHDLAQAGEEGLPLGLPVLLTDATAGVKGVEAEPDRLMLGVIAGGLGEVGMAEVAGDQLPGRRKQLGVHRAGGGDGGEGALELVGVDPVILEQGLALLGNVYVEPRLRLGRRSESRAAGDVLAVEGLRLAAGAGVGTVAREQEDPPEAVEVDRE